jgi:two-component system uhpT operon response regulator UhpA
MPIGQTGLSRNSYGGIRGVCLLSITEAAARRDSRIRVGIVDDHRLVLDGLSARLSPRSLGISVVATESNWADLLQHREFPMDVVVIDLHLNDNIPIGAKLLALQSTGTAAVVMSRHSDTASVSAAMHAGAWGFVPKTDSADQLIAAIRAAAAGRRHLSIELENALANFSLLQNAGLGRQELRALVLYAGGRSIKEVAHEMTTTEETVKSYIKRARRKYRQVSIDLGTRVLLRRHAIREGWISSD